MGRPRIVALFGSAIVFGQERGNMEALCALRDHGCEVLCLVRDEAWNTAVPPALDAVGLKWRKVAYIEQRMPGRMRWFLFRNPIAFIRANARFFRIVREFKPTHVHAFNSLFVLNFLIGLALLRIPLVYRCGEQPFVHSRVWKLVWGFLGWRAQRVVANTRYIFDELVRSGISPEKIQIIYSAPPRRLSPARFVPPGGFEEMPLRFVYIGRISADKGVGVLVDAFRQLLAARNDVGLLIAGQITDWWADRWARELRDQVTSDPQLEKRIVFLGHVEDVQGLLAFCQVHVCPSVAPDALANVVMEAKAAMRPSIVFPSGGLPEIIEDGVDGFVCAEKTAGILRDVMQSYIADPALAARQGLAARDSLERLGVNRFGEAWLKAYGAAP